MLRALSSSTSSDATQNVSWPACEYVQCSPFAHASHTLCACLGTFLSSFKHPCSYPRAFCSSAHDVLHISFPMSRSVDSEAEPQAHTTVLLREHYMLVSSHPARLHTRHPRRVLVPSSRAFLSLTACYVTSRTYCTPLHPSATISAPYSLFCSS